MTSAPRDARAGRLLLCLARLVFHEAAIERLVHPTIADLREEMREAPGRAARLLARARGYAAFWALVLHAPFVVVPATAADARGAAFPDRVDRIARTLIVLTVVASIWLAAGAWTFALAGLSLLAAGVAHLWHARYPAPLLGARRPWPEINVSAVHVGGDLGGLMFVVGSIAIVMSGIPMARWFLSLAVVAGCAVAAVLIHRHAGGTPPPARLVVDR